MIRVSSRTAYSLFVFGLFAVIGALRYSAQFRIGFTADDIVFMAASKIPETSQLAYWLKIFSSPNSWTHQYRPLGFFAYFFFFRKLFGENFVLWRLLPILTFALTMVYVIRSLEVLKVSKCVAWVFAFFFFFHYANVFSTLDMSCWAKLHVTMLILTYGWWRILEAQSISLKLAATLTILCFLLIGLHEAAITFSFCWLLTAWGFNKKGASRLLLTLIPSAIYLVVRLWVWQLPQVANSESGMALDFSALPKIFFYLFGLLSFNQSLNMAQGDPRLINGMSVLGFLFFLFFLGLGIYFYWIRKEKKILMFFLSATILILPFAPMSRHLYDNYFKADFWASLPFTFMLAMLAMNLIALNKFRKIFYRILLCLLIIVNVRASIRVQTQLLQFQTWLYNKVQLAFIGEIRKQVENSPPGTKFLVEDMGPVADWWIENFGAGYVEHDFGPALTAFYFPQYEFYFPKKIEGFPFLEGSWVHDGVAFYVIHLDDPTQLWRQDAFEYRKPLPNFDFKPEKKISIEKSYWQD
jgi:hypothetical protein